MTPLKRRLQIDCYVGGLLHISLKPIVILLGFLLRRDHKLENCRTLTVLKLLGGGSFGIAYPSLLALKQSGRITTLRAVTSSRTKSFAEVLGIFDEIMVIRDDRILTLLTDSIRTLWRLFHAEAIVDLEMHSRLTTVFCLLSCARNRIGFYTLNSFWRRKLSTHLLFCNQSSGVFWVYDQVANIFGVQTSPFQDAARIFREQLTATQPPPVLDSRTHIGVAACCSDLCRERMLLVEDWLAILQNKLAATEKTSVIHLFGGPDDRGYLEILQKAVSVRLPGVAVCNHAREMSLSESVRFLGSMTEFITIDSSLLHFARLMGLKVTSYWGPTDPATLLRPRDAWLDIVHYRRISCSPCVHITATVPCNGRNICMRYAVDPNCTENPNPAWVSH